MRRFFGSLKAGSTHMSRVEARFKDYGKGFFTVIRRLQEQGVVLRWRGEHNPEWSSVELPVGGAAWLRDGAGAEIAVQDYVKRIQDEERWGILFKDHSVAMISYALDSEASKAMSGVVPQSFCYVFAAPERSVVRTVERASFYRIEMHPKEVGTLFGEPIIHLHGNRNKAPRFFLPGGVSPVEFLDFVCRNRFPDDWQKHNGKLVETMARMHALEQQRHEDEPYQKEAARLKQLQKQRLHDLPEWLPPAAVKRYPFGL